MAIGTKTSFGIGAGIFLALCSGLMQTLDNASADDAAPAQTPEQVKADTLLNMARYVEWPSGVFVRSNSPVMLGIYGNTPLVEEVKKRAKEKQVNGRPILVRQFFWSAPPNCNVLYVAETEKLHVPGILRKLQYTSVLTISELDDFISQGGMVHFALEDRKVHFNINMAAATNAELRVSSRLLNVADSVKWGTNGPATPAGPR